MVSGDKSWWGLPLHDIIIPLCVWVVIASYYVYQINRRVQSNHLAVLNMGEGDHYYPYYFYHMRSGWIRKNHLSGQGTANSTRDYLRALIFFAGNTALVGGLVSGYAASSYKGESSAADNYLVFKLGFSGFIFLVMFFLFLYSIRFGLHFHFLMNVKEANGVPINLMIIEKIFHASHFYYASGLRLYYTVIPLFAWVISSWALLAISPLYIYLVENYDNLSFLEQDLEDMYKGTEYAKYRPVNSIDNDCGVQVTKR